MGRTANAHGGGGKIGGETSLVQTFSIANGLSVSLCLALPLVNRVRLAGQGAPVGPGGRRARIGVDPPGATPASCPLLAAPS